MCLLIPRFYAPIIPLQGRFEGVNNDFKAGCSKADFRADFGQVLATPQYPDTLGKGTLLTHHRQLPHTPISQQAETRPHTH